MSSEESLEVLSKEINSFFNAGSPPNIARPVVPMHIIIF
jgi:hypothetical protein